MKNTNHFLSLIIPIYKQEKTIVGDIRRIKQVLDKIRYDYEIIPVIDGIIDKSFDKLKKAGIAKTMCLAYPENHGKSYAIQLGMHYAKGDYIMFFDAGGEIDPNGISMLLEHMEWYKADIIVGSKRHSVSVIKYSYSRKILSYGYYLLVKTLFGLKIKDTQAGIKVFRKKVLAKILPRLVEKKFAGDLEMLVAAQRIGFQRIYEAPIRIDYELSKVTSAATLSAIYGIFIDTLAIFYRRYVLDYYKNSHKKFARPKGLRIFKTR